MDSNVFPDGDPIRAAALGDYASAVRELDELLLNGAPASGSAEELRVMTMTARVKLYESALYPDKDDDTVVVATAPQPYVWNTLAKMLGAKVEELVINRTTITGNTYTTGVGQKMVNVHDKTDDCLKYGCVIHNPTDPHQDFPTHWREDRGIMERICPHKVGHPDKDDMNYIRRTRGDARADVESIHGCDGCCLPTTKAAT